MLAFRRLFEDDDLGAEIVGGDGSGHTGGPEPDDNDIGFDVPMVVPGARHARFALHYAILSNAGGLRCRPNWAG